MKRTPNRWTSAPRTDEAAARSLAEALALPLPLGRLLIARGYDDSARAKQFLRPQLDQLHPPTLLKDLDRAVARLAEAIRAKETILVHGDYDVDGICSTTLMTRAMRALGGTVVPFIPDRRTDGYDLGPAGVAAAKAAGARVVLTCDCGTSAHAAADDLRAAGIDLIISDHHLPGGPLPNAFAVINPRRPDDESPDKDLAAVGVAFKLALALTRALGGNENVVLNMLDLVALATVADVAPLRGENRVFVRRGLALLSDSKCAGIRALVRSAGLEGKEITAGRIGFILAPRLNALGRLDRAIRGVELLLCDSDEAALGIARVCEELNRERQDMDKRILDEAMRRVEQLDLDSTFGIVLADPSWHSGVIGIVASRVVEQTARPTFLIAIQDGIGKGSGRSIPAFDLHSALSACGDLLIKHGGHKAAAGLTVDVARVDEFAERFNQVALDRLHPDDLVRELRVDLELPLAEATDDLEKLLRHLEPFGIGNPGPLFLARDVRISTNATKIGANGVKFTVEGPQGVLETVGWGLSERSAELRAGASVDIAYKLERNEFRGKSSLQLALIDFR
ncbi:MAG TPA: single-stranded-DNA-specific exonuclease RecJ [Gemmatimonadaceae bacterium]|nr:single-stranded-DNA-specific exonuclease RecJ [Gemmatimonadaceae bacterium]